MTHDRSEFKFEFESAIGDPMDVIPDPEETGKDEEVKTGRALVHGGQTTRDWVQKNAGE